MAGQRGGVQRSLKDFNEITSLWDRTTYTKTEKHKEQKMPEAHGNLREEIPIVTLAQGTGPSRMMEMFWMNGAAGSVNGRII